MLRYKRLLHEKLYPLDEHTKPMQLRELARALQIPVPSLHNYIQFDVLPRIDNIQKMADYFNESVSSMFSEDDDLTAAMVTAVRMLPDTEKINYVNYVKKLGSKKCR
jgi:transcriptional regulator with XRE-family HTH domain